MRSPIDPVPPSHPSHPCRRASQDEGEAVKIKAVKEAEAEAARTEIQAKADAEAKFLAGQGIARQRTAIIDGLKASLGAAEDSISTERVTELLLITQYFDTLEKLANGRATTVFASHSPEGVSGVAAQVRGGLLQAQAGLVPAAMAR